jgi:ABC-type multidrug transport system fused ATPase/permease subunit
LIKTFATEQRETARLARKWRELLRSGITQSILSTLSNEAVMLITGLGGLLVLGYSGQAIMVGALTLGTYLAFVGYLSKFYYPIQMFASTSLVIQPAITALTRVFELLDLTGEEEDASGHRLARLQGSIRFDRVNFSYESSMPILKDITFEIRPGEHVAFVGPSGSGKTTLIHLLLGLYKPSQGTISVDGYELQKLNLTALRERVGIVSQKIVLFNDTIRNNIAYSRPNATLMEIEQAAEDAGLNEFLSQLPAGLETRVGECGSLLSGGQMQRISLARTLLKNPDIIILDEATSHLDVPSEKRIYRTLKRLFAGKTMITVAHRLSIIADVDRIFVLDQGHIVQVGTHAELLRLPGPYRSLYDTAEDTGL